MVVLLEAPRDSIAEEFTANLFRNTDAFLRSQHVDGLLPAHFTAATLPKLGARLLVHTQGSRIAAYGFALPSVDPESGLPDEKSYIVRGYRLDPGDNSPLPEGWYDVGQSMTEDFPGEMVAKVKTANDGILSIYHPDRSLAQQAKKLQGQVWKSNPQDCYEFDLYNRNNGSATSLVVIDEMSSQVVGALLGFYGRNWKWVGDADGEEKYGMWLESQIAAV